ncbi:ssDNA-binding protein [Nitratireductor soli]|uniref:ssDNA-binding protein n=1 Tax=Nitratireductor soli TaxID=1670619 RepID=UPI0009E37D7D|nr:ssDNA-binding protein [Nitratireductor soli]
MAKKMARGEPFRTPDCTVSFAFGLFKSRTRESDDGSKRESWDCTLIFDEAARLVLEKEIAQVITAEWGEKGIQMAKDGLIKSPLLSGTGKEARNKETGELHPGMGEGKFFIRVTSNKAPVVRYKDPNIPATEEEVYSGCRGFAVINAFSWYNPKNGNGVSFGIEYFQKKGEGERLGGSGGIDPEKWHEKIEDEGEAPSETKSGAGAGGLFG